MTGGGPPAAPAYKPTASSPCLGSQPLPRNPSQVSHLPPQLPHLFPQLPSPGQLQPKLRDQLPQPRSRPAARQPSQPGRPPPQARRNRDGQRREELMTAPQRGLHQFLRQKVRQPQLPATEDYPMPAGWRDLVSSEETLN